MTQTLRPALIGLLPALAAAVLLALLLAGRLGPAIPMNPVIELPGIGITPTAAPAAPSRTSDAAPVIERSNTTPGLEPAAPANPTTMPGTEGGAAPNATAAPGATILPPSRPVGDQDPWPYPNQPNPNLPIGKGPASQ